MDSLSLSFRLTSLFMVSSLSLSIHRLSIEWLDDNHDKSVQCQNLAALARCTSIVGQSPSTTSQIYTLDYTFARAGFYHILIFNCQRLRLALNVFLFFFLSIPF